MGTRKVYYTPTDVKTPLMGSLVGDRSVVSDASNPDNYHDIIKNTPVNSFIVQDAMTQSLDILIKDIEGKDLDHIINNQLERFYSNSTRSK